MPIKHLAKSMPARALMQPAPERVEEVGHFISLSVLLIAETRTTYTTTLCRHQDRLAVHSAN